MVFDPKARIVSMNFKGGSVSAELGLLEAVFGADLADVATQPENSTVSVGGHSRVRVIGGPSKAVGSYNYARKKYPSSQGAGGAGGEAIAFLENGKWWTARLTGSHQSFNTFLSDAGATSAAGTIFWKSEKGTKYGPF